jgi:DNA replication and repair protein RecF
LILRSLRALDWRNLEPVALAPGPRATVFFGHNGQGKTNLLEAAHYLIEFRSFRSKTPGELPRFGSPVARLAAEVTVGGLERKLEVEVGHGRKSVRLDGKAIRRDAHQLRGLGVVVFVPDDLLLPRAAPAARRSFLDRAAYNADRLFYAEAVAYQKVLKSRNALLRRGHGGAARPELLSTYDDEAARTGARLVMRRRQMAAALAPRVRDLFVALHADLDATLAYRSHPRVEEATTEGEVGQALLAGLIEDHPVDLRRGFTGFGPHADDVALGLAGRPVRQHGSQGQLRSLVLSLKLAELANLASVLGEPPLLLLDDVASELDGIRRHKLFETITALPGQTFITVTDRDLIPALPGRVDFEVAQGHLRQPG